MKKGEKHTFSEEHNKKISVSLKRFHEEHRLTHPLQTKQEKAKKRKERTLRLEHERLRLEHERLISKFVDREYFTKRYPIEVLIKCTNCGMFVPKYLPNCVSCSEPTPKIEIIIGNAA